MANKLSGLKIHINGIVQGVGFRPFIYNLANTYHLTGWIRNTSSGVDIEINGPTGRLQSFLQDIPSQAPPLAQIDEIISQPCTPNGYDEFRILNSQPQAGEFIPVSPDMSICLDCQAELFDPDNRRYRYPFINCTNCGPRFSIIKDIPYDRPLTTMSAFALCPSCKKEYEDPSDRRFHAQPVACAQCGPSVWFQDHENILCRNNDAIRTSRDWIKKGKILAIKGLGGFQLVCDAENQQAVAELRRRKKRSRKPFALMAFDIEAIQKHCRVSSAERRLLESAEKPIVILTRRDESTIAAATAPGQNTLGFMLPYTPLHLLLTEKANNFPEILVMTSGNSSEEPIVYQDEEIFDRLQHLVDGFLLHDRPIHVRVDDSVVREMGTEIYPLRRARGYAPNPIRLSRQTLSLLATGADLKNTFCLTRDKYAFVSQYIGDLENYPTLQSFEEGIAHFEKLFRIKPRYLACDLHPDYHSTKYASLRAEKEGIPLLQIQHHHAHLAACLADNHWQSDEPVIGICLDGTGMGTDGTIWGGEFLYGNYRQFQRLAHLDPVPLPGGDASVRKPARMALSFLWHYDIDWEDDLLPARYILDEEKRAIHSQLKYKINTPMTSSMGRLFDAVSALLGVCQEITYEGQAAIELEALADPHENGFYNFENNDDRTISEQILRAILMDIRSNKSPSSISAKFHNTVSEWIIQTCIRLRKQTGCNTAALSGGVWQNVLLLKSTIDLLKNNDFQVLIHHQVPSNDGGLSLGQAVIAAHIFEENGA